MYVLARFAPAGTPLAAALAPAAAWTTETHALASIIDVLRLQVWLLNKGEGIYPEPLSRPGYEPEDDVTSEVDRDLDPVSPEVLDAWYKEQFPGTISAD